MNLRWDPQALQDLREIRRYIAKHGSRGAADGVREYLRSRANMLRNSPLMGVASGDSGIRILFPTRYPYRIYYSIQGGEVVILHIRHTARQAPDDLGL